MSENIDNLHALAAALLDYEILDGDQIDRVLQGKKLAPKMAEKEEVLPKKKRTRKSTKISGTNDDDSEV